MKNVTRIRKVTFTGKVKCTANYRLLQQEGRLLYFYQLWYDSFISNLANCVIVSHCVPSVLFFKNVCLVARKSFQLTVSKGTK